MSHNNRLLETTHQLLGTNTSQSQELQEGEPGDVLHHWKSRWATELHLGKVRIHRTQCKWTTAIWWGFQRSTDPDKLLTHLQIPQRVKEIVGSRECKSGAWQTLNFAGLLTRQRENWQPSSIAWLSTWCFAQKSQSGSNRGAKVTAPHFAKPTSSVILLQQWLNAMKFLFTDACK